MNEKNEIKYDFRLTSFLNTAFSHADADLGSYVQEERTLGFLKYPTIIIHYTTDAQIIISPGSEISNFESEERNPI